MSSSYSLPPLPDIPKLTDYKEDFTSWKYTFNAVMSMHGFPLPSKDEKFYIYNPELNRRYFGILSIAIGSERMGLAMMANDDIYKLWTILNENYEGTSLSKYANAKKNLLNFRWREGDTISTHLDRFTKLREIFLFEEKKSAPEMNSRRGTSGTNWFFWLMFSKSLPKDLHHQLGSIPIEDPGTLVNDVRKLAREGTIVHSKKECSKRKDEKVRVPMVLNTRLHCTYCNKDGHLRKVCPFRLRDNKKGVFGLMERGGRVGRGKSRRCLKRHFSS